MFKSELLKSIMVLKKVSSADLSGKIGINITTFYKKMNGQSEFTRSEMRIIKAVLNLSKDEMDSIFFDD